MKRGAEIGEWTVLGPSEIRVQTRSARYWKCRCRCGTERMVNEQNLLRGESTTCGCSRRANQNNAEWARKRQGQRG